MIYLPFFHRQTRFEKAATKYNVAVAAINKYAPELSKAPDETLKQRMAVYKNKPLSELQKNLPEIFALVREAGGRTIKMRHFDVQLAGGLALLDGKITEMKTGEGKTLVATLPLIVHGLSGQGAHLVTVNDYLAERDANWMGPLYQFFGLTTGVVKHGQSSPEKRAAYAADITYGTNNEFGFDYLRDNMSPSIEDLVQRPLNFAIVDEVDSILIDEARTPLIISAPDAESTQLYQQFSELVPRLTADQDYNIDEKRRAAMLTEEGTNKIEQLLGMANIYEEKGLRFVHHLEQALRAHTLYHRDKDYVVKDGQVIIVDEFTGRLMEGRRYSDGLHQAIEAKEKVKVQQESRTLATITFQNFFRLYRQLSGMTGTAATSAEEFEKVYNLEVVVIPTNQPMIRRDKSDRIFINEKAKYQAVVSAIKNRHQHGQPVLVGTIAIEKSEYLSQLLNREGIKHETLNAKQHAREAEIISRAGQKDAVTISTNMAGRGTDIKLGTEVPSLGGLFVLGTEKHEARRIDNQLRGRSGRQGDPGETQFFVSLEDDVMRIFGGERIKNLMMKLKVPPDEPIENKLVTKAIDGAQERVEGYYFDMRKQVLSYDDVLNKQRGAIYKLRQSLLLNATWQDSAINLPLSEYLSHQVSAMAATLVAIHTAPVSSDKWNIAEIAESTASLTGADKSALEKLFSAVVQQHSSSETEDIRQQLQTVVAATHLDYLKVKSAQLGSENMAKLRQTAAIRSIDLHWMDHLDTMDYIRTGIGLRGYGQRDPLVEYQKEGYQMFQQLIGNINASLIETVFKAQPAFSSQPAREISGAKLSGASEVSALHQLTHQNESASNPATIVNTKKAGRNDPCPCGSGKKYKKCHGK